jgi:photosystem II stability/assembly factor-like uncharacterized protein
MFGRHLIAARLQGGDRRPETPARCHRPTLAPSTMLLSRALLSLSATTLLLSAGVPFASRHQTPSLTSPTPPGPDSAFLANYKWRNIGPDRGGRSIAVSGVKGHPKEAYFGATGGGLWKTTDGGDTWKPVTDGQINSASVGAVAVSQSDPNVVYIGMGESCIRGNIMPGDGVYRSTDAGKTWTHVGFRNVDAISKIRIHPTNPDIVFAAVFGKYSVPSAERGVYKSSDGGKTWKRVLFRDDKTGAVDLTIDPSNPQVMYAALWEAYRNEYHMSSGGPGSGLFKSIDGGETWTEITRNAGMPSGVIGRIGVAAGPDGKRVYALVENEKGGLFSSDDAGVTWKLVNDNRAIRQRAFYYTHVFADPKNADVVYLENTTLFRSTDGGKTTKSINNGTHGDFHDLWIDPDDATHLVVGNDGGGAVSMNTGGKWTEEDYPTEQFYHVAATKHIPYHVCGAQQDNSTLCIPFDWNAGSGGRRGGDNSGPSDPTQGGMAQAYVAGGGEPGYIAPDPRDPDQFYSGANNGSYLDKYNRRLGTSREVNPYPWFYSGEPSSAIRERWQWTYPILFSPVDPRTLYVSSQRLWKTMDGGQTWTALSGDLTRHDPKTQGPSGGPITGDMNGPEVYGVIFSVGPSKRDVNVIWTGSDDGLVHVTRDGGKTWTNVTPPGMPELGRVSQIDASAFETGRAYVSVRRPLLDDRAPYIFKTSDYGRTWTKIVDGIPRDAYVHVVREDSTKRGLLYAGTQHGVYVSYDDGASWQSLALNMPDVPVADLIVQGNELIIATHGRGFWALDNIAPLRQWSPTVASQDLHLFTPPQAVRSGPALVLSWYAKQAPKSTKLEILDSTGTVLRTMVQDSTKVDSLPKNASHADSARVDSMRTAAASVRRYAGGFLPKPAKGLNHVSWDLRAQGVESFPGMILWGAGTAGPVLPPGHYTVRVTADAHTATAPVTIVRNPRLPVTDADLRAQYAFSRKVRDRATEANRRVVEIRRVKSQLEDRYTRSSDAALHAAGDTLAAHASAVEEKIYQVRNRSGQDPLNFPIKVNNRLATLLSMNEQGDGRPTNNLVDIFGILTNELTGYENQLRQVWRTDLVRVNGELTRLSLPPLDPQCTDVKGCAAKP